MLHHPRLFPVAVLLAALAVASAGPGCGGAPAERVEAASVGAGVSQAARALPPPALAALPVPRTQTLGKGVVVDVEHDGDGPALTPGGRARLHYTARVAGADTAFDGTLSRGVPLAVELGRTPLVPGLRLALEGRRAGARFTARVPAALAWGDSPSAPVPAGSDVVFDVHVVSVP